MSFLTNSMQATKLGFNLFTFLSITRSIVEGSAIGPTLFIIFAYDLKPQDAANHLLKYADDSTLISPQNSKTPVETEMAHIMKWARENKLMLNLLKTVELVFHRPNLSHELFPPVLPNITRVVKAKLLGVQLSHDLNFAQHADSVVTMCNQRLYLLAQLKKQGLGIIVLDSVFRAIVLNKILYALPIYIGYLAQGQISLLQRVIQRASRRGFTPYYYDLELLAEQAQYDLFMNSCCETHCLNHIYSVKQRPHGAMRLRKRGHDFVLPNITYEFNKRNFIVRSLFDYV